jgi:hypothetical protein
MQASCKAGIYETNEEKHNQSRKLTSVLAFLGSQDHSPSAFLSPYFSLLIIVLSIVPMGFRCTKWER